VNTATHSGAGERRPAGAGTRRQGITVTCRWPDLLKPELAQLEADVRRQAQEKGITLAENAIDDVLTVALFPQMASSSSKTRHNPAAFEPVPQAGRSQTCKG
jgi:oxaloacetate decarboxylase alpha subunit